MEVMESLKTFKKNAKVTFVKTSLGWCDADF